MICPYFEDDHCMKDHRQCCLPRKDYCAKRDRSLQAGRDQCSAEFAGSVTKTLDDGQMIDIIMRSYQRMGRTVTETAWKEDARGFRQLVLVFGDE